MVGTYSMDLDLTRTLVLLEASREVGTRCSIKSGREPGSVGTQYGTTKTSCKAQEMEYDIWSGASSRDQILL